MQATRSGITPLLQATAIRKRPHHARPSPADRADLGGSWRSIYVITAMIALYLNCFVLVVQLFEKVPALHAAAPNGKEPPFVIAQVTVMVIFIVFTILGVKKFHPVAAAA